MDTRGLGNGLSALGLVLLRGELKAKGQGKGYGQLDQCEGPGPAGCGLRKAVVSTAPLAAQDTVSTE